MPDPGESSDPAVALGLRSEPPHEYGSGPPTRWSQPWLPGAAEALTAFGALLVGFLLVAGVSAGRSAAVQMDERKAELIELIRERQEHADTLGAQLEELRERVAETEAAAAAGVPALSAQLERYELAVGLTPVRGAGVVVTLADADVCRSERPADCRIQDVDLQLAVNALLGVGAEAVAVNGERVIATTALRSAGQSVLVNYRVLTSPYRVEAVGDPEALHEGLRRSELVGDFQVWRDAYGLGFSVEAGEVTLPGFSGSLRTHVASVVDRGADTPGSAGGGGVGSR